MKKQITLQVLDWAYKVNKESFADSKIARFLQKHLGQKYDFKWANRPKYLLYGPFGDSHLDYDESCVRIFCTGENLRTDWNLADYGIDYDLFDFGGGGGATPTLSAVFLLSSRFEKRTKKAFALRFAWEILRFCG